MTLNVGRNWVRFAETPGKGTRPAGATQTVFCRRVPGWGEENQVQKRPSAPNRALTQSRSLLFYHAPVFAPVATEFK
jgi:hypothetical protein